MFKTKRVVYVAVVFFVVMFLTSFPPIPTVEASSIQIISGVDRYSTAVLISEQLNSEIVQNVIIASGNDFPDSLSVSVFAKKIQAPILLIGSNIQDSITAFKYISDHMNKKGTIYIIGGSVAVDISFETQLKNLGYSVERIGGIDRYETNFLIIQKLNAVNNTPVVIASGINFPDALSISSIAASNGWPILLTNKNELSINNINYLTEKKPSNVYIIGGTSVISEKLESEIETVIPDSNVIRLAGQDRFDTNILVVKTFIKKPKNVYISSGNSFADALTGSVLAAKTGDPVVLVDSKIETLPPTTAVYLSENSDNNLNLIILGGSGVVSEKLLNNVKSLLNGSVNYNSVYSISDIIETVYQNQTYQLPTTVTAILYNSEVVSKSVVWSSPVDISMTGQKNIEGSIEGYNGKIKLIINIVGYKITTNEYGKSGEGRPLYVTSMEVSNPKKVVLATFELHGWEDGYQNDGQVLVNIGNSVIAYFTAHPNELENTSLFIISSANPDGIVNGWTNNGPGRCQVSEGIDLNRDFSNYWSKNYNSRNKTLSPFSAPESRALRDLVLKIKPTDVVDIHGWLGTTFGSSNLCSYFNNTIGIGRSGGLIGAPGYFSAWAMNYAPRTALVELPSPSTNPQRVINAFVELCAD
ncbi:MAG: cell wall-binding repeat-containing protein [Candidatus Shapirobacteria bacterium]|jgi:putative cell wall-binding protein